MKVVKKLGMAALGCLCVGLSIGNINTAYAGKGIHYDPTGKAYKKVKGNMEEKIYARYFNMKQAIETEHWEKVEEYTDPARTRNYEKTFADVYGVDGSRRILRAAFEQRAKSKSPTSMKILLRLIDTECKLSKDDDSYHHFADCAKKDWQALLFDLDEDDAVKVVEATSKHTSSLDELCGSLEEMKKRGIKCDFLERNGEESEKLGLLDMSIFLGKKKLYNALRKGRASEFKVETVMKFFSNRILGIKSSDTAGNEALLKEYGTWLDEYGKTVDEKTYNDNVISVISKSQQIRAKREKEAKEELARRKAKEQEELAKKKAEQLQRELGGYWNDAFEAGDIAKIIAIKRKGYEPTYYKSQGGCMWGPNLFFGELVRLESERKPHMSAEKALVFLERLVNEGLTGWDELFWSIADSKLQIMKNKDGFNEIDESKILTEIAKGIAQKGGVKIGDYVGYFTVRSPLALDY